MANSNIKYTKDSSLKGIDLSPLETGLDNFLNVINNICKSNIGTSRSLKRTMVKVIESDGITFRAKVILTKTKTTDLAVDFTLDDPNMTVISWNDTYSDYSKFETDITSIDVAKIR